MSRNPGRAGCFVALALLATAAGSTTIAKLGNHEMAVQADAIVVGRCASATSEWVGGTLMTLIRVEIDESLKGAASGELTMVIPGGVDLNREIPVSVIFPGAPSVLRDENVLVFLSDSVAVGGAYDIVGFNQGKFTVVDQEGTAMVVAPGNVPVTLDAMKGQIQSALADAQ